MLNAFMMVVHVVDLPFHVNSFIYTLFYCNLSIIKYKPKVARVPGTMEMDIAMMKITTKPASLMEVIAVEPMLILSLVYIVFVMDI